MKIDINTLHYCVKKKLGYDVQSDVAIDIIKMYLQTDYHPLFKLNHNIKTRLQRFFQKYNVSIMRLIETSNNDVCLLHELHSILYTPPKNEGGSDREKSRMNDIFYELKIIKKEKERNKNEFNYLDLGCSEGKITKAVISELSLSPEQSHACDIFDQKPEKEYTFSLNTTKTLPYNDNQFDFITLFMSAHHFSHVDDMFNEIRRILKPNGFVLIREHHYNSIDDTIFYNIIHALWACVFNTEMTPYKFIKEYDENKYAYYRSIKDWILLFKKYGFQSLDSYGNPGEWSHGYFDKKTKKYLPDQMNAFYQLFRLKK